MTLPHPFGRMQFAAFVDCIFAMGLLCFLFKQQSSEFTYITKLWGIFVTLATWMHHLQFGISGGKGVIDWMAVCVDDQTGSFSCLFVVVKSP